MVLDGGGHFIPAGIFGLHTLSLLLASWAAHVPRKLPTNTRDTHTSTNLDTVEHKDTLNVGTVHKTRQGSINSVPL